MQMAHSAAARLFFPSHLPLLFFFNPGWRESSRADAANDGIRNEPEARICLCLIVEFR